MIPLLRVLGRIFFENNPWILGAGLGVPLFTAWNSDKLETVVRGNSFTGKGKRVDALYQTSGIVKSLVFAEIKKPTTKLLTNDEYRPGCWAASKDLSGGIFQVHATVQAAEDEVSEHVVTSQDEEGCDIPSSEVFLFRPRAYLVIGSTKEFINENGGGKTGRKLDLLSFFGPVLSLLKLSHMMNYSLKLVGLLMGMMIQP